MTSEASRSTGPGPRSAAQLIGTFEGGGAQRAAWNLAVALGRGGVRSFAIALRERGGYAEGEEPKVRPVVLGARRGRPLSILRAVLRLRSFLARERPDILHVHGQHSLRPAALALAGMRRRPRLWFTWHDSGRVLSAKDPGRERLKKALRRCDRIFGSSRSVCERLARELGPRPGAPEPEPFPNAVREGPESVGLASSPPEILWVGRIAPPKDPEILVRAAADLREEGHPFHITMAGGPPPGREEHLEALRSLVSELRLEDWVELPGFVSDLASRVHHAALGVQTSRTEGLSLALLEQKMAGLAIVATDVGDTGLAVEDAVTGLLIPPGDRRRLVDALRVLLLEPERRNELGAAAREDALRRHGLDGLVEFVAERYRPRD